MSDDNATISSFGLYAGCDTWVHCFRYADTAPILHIDSAGLTVTISPKGRAATESAVDFARALLREVQAFAAEVERLNAANTANAESAESAGQAA